jgi:hypothetical protein
MEIFDLNPGGPIMVLWVGAKIIKLHCGNELHVVRLELEGLVTQKWDLIYTVAGV